MLPMVFFSGGFLSKREVQRPDYSFVKEVIDKNFLEKENRSAYQLRKSLFLKRHSLWMFNRLFHADGGWVSGLILDVYWTNVCYSIHIRRCQSSERGHCEAISDISVWKFQHYLKSGESISQ
jgi:23S rRNA G2069 N7-methylase RlmK/C1962 C5-methylase RlmI